MIQVRENSLISVLRHWLVLNRPLLHFVYGQIFVIFGLAIFLHSRRHSRLELAISLRWIMAFGFIHGFHEWGDLFIPIQSSFLSASTIVALRFLQLFLLAGSFNCLHWFAVELLKTFPHNQRRYGFIPAGAFALWLIGSLCFGLVAGGDLERWRSFADVLARYLLGLSGGVMAAYALRCYARIHIVPLDLPHIYKTLRVSGISLAAYCLFGVLLGPREPFFPATIINAEYRRGDC